MHHQEIREQDGGQCNECEQAVPSPEPQGRVYGLTGEEQHCTNALVA